MNVWQTATWRWFRVRASHLLASDTPLARHFAPAPKGAGPSTGVDA